jgi:hypothetical protein
VIFFTNFAANAMATTAENLLKKIPTHLQKPGASCS